MSSQSDKAELYLLWCKYIRAS